MKPRIQLEKRGREWVVVMRSGTIAYSNTCYPKAVGVFEYLESRRAEQEAKTARDQAEFREAHT